MSLVDSEAARPNGSAGPPAMAPPDAAPADASEAAPFDTLTAVPPETARAAEAQVPPPRWIRNFAGTERRLLSHAEVAALKAEARRHVEGTTLSLREIAQRLDIAASTLSRWKAEENWTRPAGAPVRPAFSGNGPGKTVSPEARRIRMIGRLYRVFDRQTADLEARAVRPGGTTDEKDARTLSVLAKTLETLIALDRDDGAKATKPESVDRADYRAELARTLSRWAEEGGRSGGTEPPPV
jgi:transposase-like protein